jgi:hypothetical protein
MSVVPNAGVADTLATGGSTTTLDVLVVVGMVVDGDGLAVEDAVVSAAVVMAGTETAALEPAAAVDAVGELAAVTWLDTVTVLAAGLPDVQDEASTATPIAADTSADRRTARKENIRSTPRSTTSPRCPREPRHRQRPVTGRIPSSRSPPGMPSRGHNGVHPVE